MANNQLVNQPGRESSSIGLPWRLMVFSLVLFVFSLLIYAGLKFGYGTYIDSQIEEVDNQIINLTSEVSEEQQEEILTFHSQLSNLQKVLGERDFSQNIFNFLERNTLSNVYYVEADYVSSDLRLELQGAANSVRTLVEQLYTIEQAPEVNRSIIDSIDASGGQASFVIDIYFNPEFFNQIN